MADSPHPPLKRHVSLQPFSRDHYVGLVHAQHLIKSADTGPGERRKTLSEFLQAWGSEIFVHFQDEERLLPKLIIAETAERLLREHRALAALAEEARDRASAADPGADWVRALGQMLNDHIRWEERELFPLIERIAPPERLAALEDETARIEQTRPRNLRRTPRGASANADEKPRQ